MNKVNLSMLVGLLMAVTFLVGFHLGDRLNQAHPIYLDDKMKQCDDAGGDYTVYSWINEHHVYCNLPAQKLFDFSVSKNKLNK